MNAPAAAQPAGPPEPRPASRLNPFSFPSNTDFFFALLVFAVLAVSLQIFSMYFLWNDTTSKEYIAVFLRCQNQYGVTAERINAVGFSTLTELRNACWQGIERQRSLWMVAGVLLVVALGGLIYWFTPAWITRRGRLSRLSAAEFPQVVERVEAMSRAMGLPRPPDLYWSPFELSASGMAFGRMGRYAVKLTGGLVSQFFSDPPAFQAVMLHELAHIRSKDIDKTYLTVALWNAFLVGTLAPFFIILLGTSTDLILDISWRILLLVLLVYLIRNVVLRSREYYADLRAYQYPPARAGLRQMLARLPVPKAHLARRALAVHPHPAQRLSMLDDPLPLFEQGALAALATGMVAGIGYEPLMGFLIATGLSDGSLLAFLTGFFVAPLVVCIIGLGVWRSAFAAHFDRRARLNTVLIAFALAVGALLGRAVSLVKLLPTAPQPPTLVGMVESVLLAAGWIFLLTLSLALFFRWMALSAASWLPSSLDRSSPGRFSTAGMVAAALVLSPWFGAAFLTLYLAEDLALISFALPLIFVGYVILALPSLVTTMVLVILWAFPLASQLRGRWQLRRGRAFVDASIPVTAAANAAPLPVRFSTALVPALMMAAAFAVLGLFLRLGLRAILPQAVRDQDSTSIAIAVGSIVLAAVFQVLVAAWVTARANQLRVFQGMFAAFVAGCLMAAASLLVNLLLGGSAEFAFVRVIFGYTVNSGGIAAIPFVLLVNGLFQPPQPAAGPSSGQVYPAAGRT